MVNITLIVFFLIGAIGVAYCSYKNVTVILSAIVFSMRYIAKRSAAATM